MPELAKPYEYLELKDGQSVELAPLSFEKGQGVINPAHALGGKAVTILRLQVDPKTKEHWPPYWDVSQAGLVAQLEPLLNTAGAAGLRVIITAHGFPPKKRYSVETRPR